MKRFCTGLSGVLLMLMSAGCNDYGNTFQGNTGATLTSISPQRAAAGSGDQTITMNGAGFVKQTVVQWNGSTNGVTTNPTLDANGNVTLLQATISHTLLTKPGINNVNTLNPASGAGNNGLSVVLPFYVDSAPNPVPTITTLSPSCAQTGSGTLTLNITGTNFLAPSSNQTSTVNWQPSGPGGQVTQLTATVSSATQIQATVQAALLAAAASVNVTVSNPPSLPANFAGAVGSGGGASAPAVFTVQAAACPPGTTSKAAGQSATSVVEETPAVSTDGRFVAYTATQGDHAQVFVRDTCAGADSGCQSTTQLVSAAQDGTAANDDSRSPSISGDGRFVAFSSPATNLVQGAPAGRQIFLRDTCQGADQNCKPSTQLISVDSSGVLVGTESVLPSISSSGRFVAFLAITPAQGSGKSAVGKGSVSAPASNQINSGLRQIFVRDTCLGGSNCTPKTTRISLQPGDGSGEPKPAGPALTGNAKQIAASGAQTSTLFTHSVAVDDRVFLAATH